MRIAQYLTAITGVLFAALLFTAGPAQADDLCPSDESVLKSSKSDPPYQCAVHNWSSKKSIGAWDTKSWSSDTALGYEVESKCAYRSSSDVSWTWAAAGPSYSATFTNWADGTRHFGTGVIFTTGSVDDDQIKSKNDCATGDGKITNAITKITKSVTIDSIDGANVWGETQIINGTVSPSGATGYVGLLVNGQQVSSNGQPVAAPIVDGKFSIPWKTSPNGPTTTVIITAGYPGDYAKCPEAAKTCGWTGGQSQNVSRKMNMRIDNSPVDPVSTVSSTQPDPLLSSSATVGTGQGATISGTQDPGVSVKSAAAEMPGKLGLRCAKGSFPLHTEVFGANGTVIQHGNRGSRIEPGRLNGRKVRMQLTCRGNDKPVANIDRVGYGTRSANTMATTRKRGVLFGGPGADRLRVNRKGGSAFGGQGPDRIAIGAANGVAVGGPGNDRIRSAAAGRTLLIGGAGRDAINAGGNARVNARDGERDRVHCRGAKVRVKADRFDHLSRTCRRV